jgi:hypothetical protein
MALVYLYICFILFPRDNENSNYIKQRSFYAERDKSVEVFCIGNSNLRDSFDPVFLYKNYGITSFNNGVGFQSLENSFGLLKEANTKQNFKYLIIETNYIFHFDNGLAYYGTPVQYYLSVPWYNKSWDSGLTINNFFQAPSFEWVFNPLKGFNLMLNRADSTKFYSGYKAGDSTESAVMDSGVKANLDKIVNYAKGKNMRILFLSTPSIEQNVTYYNCISNYSQENECDFIDMNLNYSEIGITAGYDFWDLGVHLNRYGADKVTKYLGDYLAGLNIFTDFRNAKNNDLWEESVSYYDSL